MPLKVKNSNQLSEVPAGNYEGYAWLSDETKPRIYLNEPFDPSFIGPGQLLTECLLFDKSRKISVHILHTGHYNISVFHLDEDPDEESAEYLPHRLPGDIDKVMFRKIWHTEQDELCENLNVKKLRAIVFTGFKRK